MCSKKNVEARYAIGTRVEQLILRIRFLSFYLHDTHKRGVYLWSPEACGACDPVAESATVGPIPAELVEVPTSQAQVVENRRIGALTNASAACAHAHAQAVSIRSGASETEPALDGDDEEPFSSSGDCLENCCRGSGTLQDQDASDCTQEASADVVVAGEGIEIRDLAVLLPECACSGSSGIVVEGAGLCAPDSATQSDLLHARSIEQFLVRMASATANFTMGSRYGMSHPKEVVALIVQHCKRQLHAIDTGTLGCASNVLERNSLPLL